MMNVNQNQPITKFTGFQREHLLAVEDLLCGLSEMLERSRCASISCDEAASSLCYSAIIDKALHELHTAIDQEALYPTEACHE